MTSHFLNFKGDDQPKVKKPSLMGFAIACITLVLVTTYIGYQTFVKCALNSKIQEDYGK